MAAMPEPEMRLREVFYAETVRTAMSKAMAKGSKGGSGQVVRRIPPITGYSTHETNARAARFNPAQAKPPLCQPR
jgi:hypothetical protein